MQCCHFIALRYIIRIACYKHNLHIVILLAQLLCHGNTIHISHLYVKQKYIIILPVIITEHKILRRLKCRYMNAMPLHKRPLVYHIIYVFSVRFAVVTDCYIIIHNSPLMMIVRFSLLPDIKPVFL